MSVVCLDTGIMILALAQKVPPSLKDEADKAERFFESLKNSEIKAIVPAIVVAEFLMGINESDHQAFIEMFQQYFILPPFDILAASTFATLWQKRQKDGTVKNMISTLKSSKHEIRADLMVIAIAKIRNAERIYSRDAGMKTIASNVIPVDGIPSIAIQPNLYSDDNSE